MIEPSEALKQCKRNIGLKLTFLRQAKANKDNYTEPFLSRIKQGLSLELCWKAQLYKRHPELRPARVKQITLFDSKEWKKLKKGKSKTAEEFAEKHGYEIIRF